MLYSPYFELLCLGAATIDLQPPKVNDFSAKFSFHQVTLFATLLLPSKPNHSPRINLAVKIKNKNSVHQSESNRVVA